MVLPQRLMAKDLNLVPLSALPSVYANAAPALVCSVQVTLVANRDIFPFLLLGFVLARPLVLCPLNRILDEANKEQIQKPPWFFPHNCILDPKDI